MIRAAALAIVLAACGGSAPAPPGPVIANTAAAPDAAPGFTGGIAEPGVGVGVLRLGTSEADVRALLGAAEPEVFDETTFYEYVDRGLTVALVGGRVDAIHLYRGGMRGGYEHDRWAPFDFRTARGITFASTYDDVIAAYGPPVSSGSLDDAPVPSRWIDYGGIMFDFVIESGAMFHVVISAP